MVASVVPHQDGIGPPVPVLKIQVLDQLRQEELHRVAIRVGLEQAGIDLTLAVESHDKGDPRADLLDG